MKCWHCEEELLWKSDNTITDDNEDEYMVTNLSCPSCDADVEIYLKDKKKRWWLLMLDLFDDVNVDSYMIKRITYEETKPFILDIHYAKRMPPMKQAYGLYKGSELVGICSYGIPPSHTLLKGVCGEEYKNKVIELNRLVLKENKKNEASILVGGSLKQLGDKVVVSYADSTQNHVGVVYQATNFLYTGVTKPMKEVYLKSKPHLHHTSHKGKTFKQMEEEYGDDVGYRLRSCKHRYVIFVGNKKFKREAVKSLRYAVLPYPKSDANKHNALG